MDEEMCDDVALVQPHRGTALATEVIELGDSQRSLLGLSPRSAWEEAFEEERVIAARTTGRIAASFIAQHGIQSPPASKMR